MYTSIFPLLTIRMIRVEPESSLDFYSCLVLLSARFYPAFVEDVTGYTVKKLNTI